MFYYQHLFYTKTFGNYTTNYHSPVELLYFKEADVFCRSPPHPKQKLDILRKVTRLLEMQASITGINMENILNSSKGIKLILY